MVGLTLCQTMEEKNFCMQARFPSLFTRRVALIHIALENCSIYPQDNPMRYYYYPHFADEECKVQRGCQSSHC